MAQSMGVLMNEPGEMPRGLASMASNVIAMSGCMMLTPDIPGTQSCGRMK